LGENIWLIIGRKMTGPCRGKLVYAVPVLYPGKDPRLVVIPDRQTLLALDNNISTSTRLVLEQLDYSKSIAIVVFRGITGVSLQLEILKIVRQGNVVSVCTQIEIPEPGAKVVYKTAYGSPYHVIVVPRARLQGATIFELQIEQVYYTH
jgi:hypothetical protein